MSTGTITCHTDSVDYGGGRGTQYSNITLRWTVEGNTISFGEESYSTNSQNWWICNSYATNENQYRLELKVQFQPTGEGWQDLFTTAKVILGPCTSYTWQTGTNVRAILEELSARIPTLTLPKSGNLRVLYYAAGTASTPMPSSSYPYAFPNSVYSEASQVPIYIDVSWTAKLEYDANGGTGAPSAQTVSVTGDSTTITVSNTIPTRTNYRFEGWELGGKIYHGGDTVTISKSAQTQTLVAKWEEFYRPGERKVSGSWKSHNRSGGACERKVNGSWNELRTIDGGVGTNDPPSRKASGNWYNMRKIGGE